ncbi:hypothetical protein RUND412_005341 [Rhizina undulata]
MGSQGMKGSLRAMQQENDPAASQAELPKETPEGRGKVYGSREYCRTKSRGKSRALSHSETGTVEKSMVTEPSGTPQGQETSIKEL